MVLAMFMLITGCNGAFNGAFTGDTGQTGAAGANGTNGTNGADGAVVTVPAIPAPLTAAQDLLAEENDYRAGLGQYALSQGALTCTLYKITGGSRIQSSISGHNTLSGLSTIGSYLYSGPFNQPNSSASVGMNVLPPALRAVYLNMYKLVCSGYIIVTANDYYNFELTSDDASLLYLDGSKLIDNDNNHGNTVVVGTKYLRKGLHTISLQYAQTGGNQSLILRAGSSTSGLSSISSEFYAY